ncbi:hypothetical protein XENORESO_009901 [Xenotaenia resolanae]|uniref:Uncharacterized protein n=1 Tax=Xenotaenia resolanae TaxID=208358 RepID=A0ABV0W2Q4_9TELE
MFASSCKVLESQNVQKVQFKQLSSSVHLLNLNRLLEGQDIFNVSNNPSRAKFTLQMRHSFLLDLQKKIQTESIWGLFGMINSGGGLLCKNSQQELQAVGDDVMCCDVEPSEEIMNQLSRVETEPGFRQMKTQSDTMRA